MENVTLDRLNVDDAMLDLQGFDAHITLFWCILFRQNSNILDCVIHTIFKTAHLVPNGMNFEFLDNLEATLL